MDSTDPLWTLAESTLERLLPASSELARGLLLAQARLVTCQPQDSVKLDQRPSPLGLVLTGRLVSHFRVIRPGMPLGEEPFLGRELQDTVFFSPSGATYLSWEAATIESDIESHPTALVGLLRRMSARHHTNRAPIWGLGQGTSSVISRLPTPENVVLGPSDEATVNPAFLAQLEQQQRHVFLDLRTGGDAWETRCKTLADAVLTLEPGRTFVHPRSSAPVHGSTPGLPGTLDPESSEDWNRLTNLVAGRAKGLVLSGGGARGFAHIGVLRALSEHGLLPDSLGGTSMGALVAAAFALDRDLDRLDELARSLGKTSRVLDWSLGATSLTTGAKVAGILAELFGSTRIEDLHSPYFCVASDLTRAKEVVFTSGRLATAVRASLAIPGVFYPVVRRGDILVDGGLMNNLPLDILARRLPGGELMACDVTTGDWLAPAGWIGAPRAIRGPFRQWTDQILPPRQGKVPALANLLLQSLEVNSRRHYRDSSHVPHRLFAIDVNGFDPLDFGKWRLLIDEGYRQASSQLATI